MRFVVLLLAVASCPHPQPSPTPIPPPPVIDGPATCADACQRGFDLGCSWARPTPEGRTCLEVCRSVEDIAPFNVDCMARANNCAAADSCP